jgi:hypothetical protein
MAQGEGKTTMETIHADIDVERMIANTSCHVHAAFAVLLHADEGIGGKMKIVALQCACGTSMR